MDFRLLMTLQVAVAGVQKIGAVPHGIALERHVGEGPVVGL